MTVALARQTLLTLTLADGLARLAAATPPTVLCASARQAQALHGEFAAHQQQRGLAVWSTPDIVSFDDGIEAWYQRAQPALLLAGRALLPRLSEAEAQLLWQLCVTESEGPVLLRSDEAAQLAAEAWQLCSDYRLDLPFADDGSADVARFNQWAQHYRRRLERLGVLDAAGFDQALLMLVARGGLQLPSTCLLYGFDSYSPRQQQWLQALAAREVELLELQPAPRRAALHVESAAEPERELRVAARWMRDTALRDPTARLAVIVPDLAARRASVQRVFDEQLCPAVDAPDAHAITRPYNLSLGQPLAQHGLVQTALRLLQLAAGELDAGVASALLLSPYWGGNGDGDAQRLQRAALDAELRRQGHLQISIEVLLQHSAAELRPYWRACASLRDTRRLGPAQWSERFAATLAACQWPGPRALDSSEYQQQQRWRDLQLSFAQLQRVLGRVSLSAALAQLRALAERAVFQPQSPTTPLQVLGVLEAQGLQFDAIRVVGLHDECWPAPARPHPFIPHALQRRHQLPHASAARELAYAQAQLANWQGSCDQLTLSYPQQTEGRELAASPLLAPYLAEPLAAPLAAHLDAPGNSDIPTLSPVWQASQRSGCCEELADAYAPAPRIDAVLSGGARVLGDQARCPFRGYALHRLGVRPLQTAAYGLQAYDRGNLVHRVLERLWAQWQTQAQLLALDEVSLAGQLQIAIAAELDRLQMEAPQRLAPVLRELEAQRLQELITQWLDVERARPPFRVLCIENREIDSGEQRTAVSEFAGLQLRLRPDRIDADADGRRIVLDYKTGALPKAPWSDGRPEEPQLLLYALIEPQVAAIAYARLSVGEVGLQGIAADDGQGLPSFASDRGTRDAASWEALQGRWRGELQTVADEIHKGWAAVLPKHPRQSCRDCGLHALCRIRDEVSLDDGEEVAT